jgi:hypothetical protein
MHVETWETPEAASTSTSQTDSSLESFLHAFPCYVTVTVSLTAAAAALDLGSAEASGSKFKSGAQQQ